MHARVKSQSGQAATEYILLLVITVAIILALMTQFFKPLQTFLTSYMGDYTACLLQTGELPSLGGNSTTAADEGCNAKFQPATINLGRPPNGQNGATPPNGAPPEKNPNSSATSSSSYGGSNSRNGSNRIFNGPRGTPSSDVTAGANGKKIEIANEGGGSGEFFKSSYAGANDRSVTKSVAISGSQLSAAEKKKLAKKAEKAPRTTINEGGGGNLKKMPLKVPERKPTSLEEEDKPFTLGNFIRMLFIICIILAIVIFVGGQVLQMSKSFEK